MRGFHIFNFILLLGILLIAPAGLTFAQEMAPPAPTSAVPDALDKIPDEYIEESMAFYDKCSGDSHLSQYYNCQCWSLALLDERIKQGPIPSLSILKLDIQGECRDAINAAGPVYQSCLRQANRFQAGTDPEKYCECVANSYVESMNRIAPRVNSRSIVNLQTQAYTSCRISRR